MKPIIKTSVYLCVLIGALIISVGCGGGSSNPDSEVTKATEPKGPSTIQEYMDQNAQAQEEVLTQIEEDASQGGWDVEVWYNGNHVFIVRTAKEPMDEAAALLKATCEEEGGASFQKDVDKYVGWIKEKTGMNDAPVMITLRFINHDHAMIWEGEFAETGAPEGTIVIDDSVKTYDYLLDGEWVINDGSFEFLDGTCFLFKNGIEQMSGDYSINTEDKCVDVTFHASDGDVNVHLPYEYANNKFKLYNNKGEEMVKQ